MLFVWLLPAFVFIPMLLAAVPMLLRRRAHAGVVTSGLTTQPLGTVTDVGAGLRAVQLGADQVVAGAVAARLAARGVKVRLDHFGAGAALDGCNVLLYDARDHAAVRAAIDDLLG